MTLGRQLAPVREVFDPEAQCKCVFLSETSLTQFWRDWSQDPLEVS